MAAAGQPVPLRNTLQEDIMLHSKATVAINRIFLFTIPVKR